MDQKELRSLAARGIEAEIERLNALLRAINQDRSEEKGLTLASSSDDAPRRRGRTMSAAARKAISKRMKQRWADLRKREGK